jgi:hypothetical protein
VHPSTTASHDSTVRTGARGRQSMPMPSCSNARCTAGPAATRVGAANETVRAPVNPGRTQSGASKRPTTIVTIHFALSWFPRIPPVRPGEDRLVLTRRRFTSVPALDEARRSVVGSKGPLHPEAHYSGGPVFPSAGEREQEHGDKSEPEEQPAESTDCREDGQAEAWRKKANATACNSSSATEFLTRSAEWCLVPHQDSCPPRQE